MRFNSVTQDTLKGKERLFVTGKVPLQNISMCISIRNLEGGASQTIRPASVCEPPSVVYVINMCGQVIELFSK